MPNLTTVGLTNGAGSSGTGSVSTLDNLIGTAGTANTNVLSVQGIASGVAQPISGTVTVNALPTGTNVIGSVKATDGTNTAAVKAASTAPLTTDPALVVSISPNSVNANGQAVMASSAPVVIASIQSTLAVSPTAVATGGATNVHGFSVTTAPAATAIKASAGTLYGVQAVNTGAAPVYLKLYNTAAASVTVGTTVPYMTIPVPTVATTGSGIVIPFPVGVVFSTAMSWTLTNVAADNDATAVAVGTTLNIQYA